MTFANFPGSYEICQICGWEDDPIQMLNPWYAGGANITSLLEEQKKALTLVKESKKIETFVRDTKWRPVNDEDKPRARSPIDLSEAEYGDLRAWYYWLV